MRHGATAFAEGAFLVATTGRTAASELAFYLPAQPRAYVWNATGQMLSQYDVWGGPQDRSGAASLIVTPPDRPLPEALATAFETVESAGQVNIPIGNGRSHQYQLWCGRGFRGWPSNIPSPPRQRVGDRREVRSLPKQHGLPQTQSVDMLASS